MEFENTSLTPGVWIKEKRRRERRGRGEKKGKGEKRIQLKYQFETDRPLKSGINF